MGSRFAATTESSAPDDFKQMYVDATEDDIVLVKSPVGLPGRALTNPFTVALARGEVPRIESCIVCLRKCGREYCIMDELVRAQAGDVEHGLVFAGEAAIHVHDIPAAAELMERLEREWAEADEESRS